MPELALEAELTFEVCVRPEITFTDWFSRTTRVLYEMLEILSGEPPGQIGAVPVDWKRLWSGLEAHRSAHPG